MTTCSVEGCSTAVYVKKSGLCRRHYERQWADDPRRPKCSVEDCDRPRRRNGMCELHDDRLSRTGTTDLRPPPTPADRLWAQVDSSGGPDACWTWTGDVGSGGYGQVAAEGGRILVHRLSYQLANGDIPPGMDIDHTCHSRDCKAAKECAHRRCVNPAHLQAITHRENILRGRSFNREKTHCKWGHEFTPENTRIRKVGGRDCRECTRRRARRPAA